MEVDLIENQVSLLTDFLQDLWESKMEHDNIRTNMMWIFYHFSVIEGYNGTIFAYGQVSQIV